MTGILFGTIVLSIILISVAGWLLAGNLAANVSGQLGRHRSRAVFVGAGVAVIAIAGGLTWWYADRAKTVAALPAEISAASATTATNVPKPGGDLAVLVDRLAARLAREPDDAQGWALFARTQMELRRYPGAATAYARAVTLLPGDADLHTERADAEFMANDRRWTTAATTSLAAALKLHPGHLEALWLSGSERFDNKDFPAAVRHWEKLARLAPADSEYAKQLKISLVEARALREGKDPAAALAAAGVLVASPATATATAPSADARSQLAAELRAALGTAPAGPKANTNSANPVIVRGEIRVDPALQNRISPEDTVFVIARDANADRSAMPLAALRFRGADLPVRFELSDNNAMSSTLKLSAATALLVTARVSKSGSAGAQPGDLESAGNVVGPGTALVSITIRKVL